MGGGGYIAKFEGGCFHLIDIAIICLRAEVVEWLRPSTAVREVAGSIPAEGIFSET